MSAHDKYTRRRFLETASLAASTPLLAARAFSQDTVTSARAVGTGIKREVFVASPSPGESVLAQSYYTRPTGVDLVSIHEIFTRSDTIDVAYYRYSSDNGRTWTGAQKYSTLEHLPQGKLRRATRGCVLDPKTGRFLRFRIEGILPGDDPLEGMWRWVVYYSVSEDGGFTWYLDEATIQKGPEFNAVHPISGVTVGLNGFMVGDIASRPIFLADGTLLVPLMITPIGPNGRYYNPGGGYTYSDVGFLRGRWGPDGRHMEWELSELIKVDPGLSTRGMDEATLAVLNDGRILAVIRGSNDKKPHLPGRRWVSYSRDQGRTWSKPEPWTYANGENFYSPAAASQLFTHSSGRIFWLGAITPLNPTGNRPRYPFIVGEVNRETGLLDQRSIRTVDDRAPNESRSLQLSSPSSREDRETGEIVVNLTRWSEFSKTADHDWTAHAYLYRIPVS